MNEAAYIPHDQSAVQSRILSDYETVTLFMQIMNDNGRELQALELNCLITALDNMKKQYGAVLDELQDVKRQLEQTPEQQPEKSRMLDLLQAAQEKVQQALTQLAAVKEKVVDWAKTAVQDFKRVGVTALDTALSALGIQKLLGAMREKVQGSIENVKEPIQRVETIGQELRSAGTHLKNAGRTAIGKETQQADGGQAGRLQNAVSKPLMSVHSTLSGVERTISKAEGAVKRLDHMAAQCVGKRERSSVRMRLEQKKSEVPATSAPAPGRKPRETER